MCRMCAAKPPVASSAPCVAAGIVLAVRRIDDDEYDDEADKDADDAAGSENVVTKPPSGR